MNGLIWLHNAVSALYPIIFIVSIYCLESLITVWNPSPSFDGIISILLAITFFLYCVYWHGCQHIKPLLQLHDASNGDSNPMTINRDWKQLRNRADVSEVCMRKGFCPYQKTASLPLKKGNDGKRSLLYYYIIGRMRSNQEESNREVFSKLRFDNIKYYRVFVSVMIIVQSFFFATVWR